MIIADHTRTNLLREWEKIGIVERDGLYTVKALVNNRHFPVVLFSSTNKEDCEKIVQAIADAIEAGDKLFVVPVAE